MGTEDRDEQAASANGREAPGGDYNLLPYPSMPFAYTQPSHLAALVSLFGFEAPKPDRARVLELGCASGGNIIPLAARFPLARFLGLDLSRRHVDDACRRVAQLGLTNVEIRQGDLAETSLAGQQFDYVICHGVFSWVPEAAQDAIFRICEETLVPNGVAAISYNLLPGWHFQSVVRDICLHHARKEASPRERVADARRVLAQIAQSTSETAPYGQFLRSEAKRLAQLPAAYILGEFLAPDNAPCHFEEFVGRAAGYGLDYLCEGDLGASISETLYPETESRIKAIAGSSRTAQEQYKDFCTGRPFRRSVLVGAAQISGLRIQPSADRLRPLHFTSRLRQDFAQAGQTETVYKDQRGRAVRVKHPAVRRALARLEKAYPATLTLKELAASDTDVDDANDETLICDALFPLVAAAQAMVSALPLSAGHATVKRPRVWRLARLEAAAKQPWVTSLHHEAVALNPVSALLVPHLDGNSDRRMLTARLAVALQSGEVRIPELKADRLPEESGKLHEVVAPYVDRAIQWLCHRALLELSAD